MFEPVRGIPGWFSGDDSAGGPGLTPGGRTKIQQAIRRAKGSQVILMSSFIFSHFSMYYFIIRKMFFFITLLSNHINAIWGRTFFGIILLIKNTENQFYCVFSF